MKEPLSRLLFGTIYQETIGDDTSPYALLKHKLYDIDIDYFEKIPAWEEVLPEELSPELTDKIMNDFKALIGQQLNEQFESHLVDSIQNSINQSFPNIDADTLSSACQEAKKELQEAAHFRFQYSPCPQESMASLMKKYKKAKQRTPGERIRRTNNEDVIDFHHALMHKTVWDCKQLIDDSTILFAEGILDKIEKH
ncbi:MAG: hypothetical protein K5920_11585 [Bacteroidales bacterium]|nr:hypothetical protein [Bacteroidales bacterium]